MSNDTPIGVVQKIRNLLRLQKRATTEGEAKAAAFAIGKLLTKYQLDLASIETEETRERAEMDREPVLSLARRVRWRVGLLTVLGEHLGVVCWSLSNSRDGKRVLDFFLCGRATDTQALRTMFAWLDLEAQRLCPYRGKDRADWLLGFAVGVQQQLLEAKRQATAESSCRSIVLTSRAEEAREVLAKVVTRNAPKMRTIRVKPDAYVEGIANGRTVPLNGRRELGASSAPCLPAAEAVA